MFNLIYIFNANTKEIIEHFVYFGMVYILFVLIIILFFIYIFISVKKITHSGLDYFKDRLIIPIIIGLSTCDLTILFKLTHWSYSEDIIIAILVVLLSFFVLSYYDGQKIYKLRKRIEKAEYIYKDIIDGHINLPVQYSKLVDDSIKRVLTKNGIITLNVSDGEYRLLLENCAKKISKSYFATFTSPYKISDIVSNKTQDVSLGDITNFFNIIKNKDIENSKRVRIYIYDSEDDFITDLRSIDNKQNLISFLHCQNNFKLYFISKAKCNKDLNYQYNAALSCDFALFDSSLVLRRSDRQELAYYFVNNECSTLPTIFRELCENILNRYISTGVYELKQTSKYLNNKISEINYINLLDKIKKDIKYEDTTSFPSNPEGLSKFPS